MHISRDRSAGPRLRPLVAGLALALATTITHTADATPRRDRGHLPALQAAIADHDVSHLQGWRPAAPARPDTETLIDAWRARPRIDLPSLVHDSSRGGVTHVVQNCDDSGPGSLRELLGIAADNDIIDLTSLVCSEITLTSGEVHSSVANVTLIGPGSDALAISGNDASRVIAHTGSGSLTIDGLAIRNGRKYSSDFTVDGGCIMSSGSVVLVESVVAACSAETAGADLAARGGAIYAVGDVLAIDSIIGDSTAENSSTSKSTAGRGVTAAAIGGGISAGGSVALIDSLVVGNGAYAQAGLSGGGGVAAANGITSKYSMIAGNRAVIAGGLYAANTISINNSTIAANLAGMAPTGVLAASAGNVVSITNSTLAGNTSQTKYGGVVIGSDAVISNSTIARNTCIDETCTASGIHMANSGALDLQSSIVAENTIGDKGAYADITSDDPTMIVTGANNLVTASPTTLPPDTITSSPKLAGPQYAGGPTPFFVLRGTSPARDAGNNAANLEHDQRGPGHPRVSGAAADIGAHETDAGDYLFADDFGDD